LFIKVHNHDTGLSTSNTTDYLQSVASALRNTDQHEY
jgi:hypothetical protein